MFNSSVYYNLRNPAFLDDICESQLALMMPQCTAMPYETYPVGMGCDMSGICMNCGQPTKDNFNGKTRSEKDWNIFKNILKFGALAAGTVMLFKGGKKLYAKIAEKFKKP